MERFYLITNRAKDPDLTVTDQIRQYLEERGKTCLLCDNSEKGEKYHYTDPAKVPSDIDGILVLGGDGTLLQAAGDVVDLQIPLLGINLGTLGYLAEIDRDTLYPALDHLMADEYTIEHRMMLCGSIYRDGKLIAEDAALNDITITREGNLRVVRFDYYVDKNGVRRNSKNICVAIDAGHQRRGNSEKEPIGPGSSTYKAKVASGTCGVATGINEYELNLAVSLKVRDILEERGYDVYMIRETHDVNISNSERAKLAVQNGADILVRVHANGDSNQSVYGALTMAPSSRNTYLSGDVISKSQKLSQKMIAAFCKDTGAKNRDVIYTDSMSGINWSTIPVTIIELGFMSNPSEDRLMATEDYRNKMAQGIADGIDAYYE